MLGVPACRKTFQTGNESLSASSFLIFAEALSSLQFSVFKTQGIPRPTYFWQRPGAVE